MNQGLIRLLKKTKMLTILYVQGRLIPHLHVLTNTCVCVLISKPRLHTWFLFQKLCSAASQLCLPISENIYLI